MDFFTVVRERHSIRAYERREVETEKLDAILQAVNSAPSAGNLQAYEVVVVKEPKTKSALAKAALGQGFIAQAPVVLIFFQNPKRSARGYGRRGAELYSLQDATIACTYAHLAATALGLSSCWVGAFYEEPVSMALNAPKDLIPVAILPIGYAAEKPYITDRRSLKDLVKWERF